jgi:hypothetical protein
MKILTVLAFVALIASPAGAQTTPAVSNSDVLGTWDITFNMQQGAIPGQLKLKADGDKIVGTVGSQMGESPVQAEVKGKDLSIWFTFQGQNGPIAITMNGTVDGDTIKGTLGFAGQAGGDWTASRAKDTNIPATDTREPAKPLKEPAAKADLTGTWSVTVELPDMTANPTVVLKQDGEKLTGDYISAQYGKYTITGTVKGVEVNFWFSMNVEGTALNVTYTGKLEKDGLTGAVNYGDMMSGTFFAEKKK